MDTAMPRDRLEELFDQAAREVTQRAAGISLCQGGEKPAGNMYTVYAVFEKGFDSSVSLCAEEALFTRLTKHMMQDERVTLQDVEDFTKEYFNMMCGHIASKVFQKTKVASRFGIPVFYQGRYQPEEQEAHFIISYISDSNENAQLIHLIPRNKKEKPAG